MCQDFVGSLSVNGESAEHLFLNTNLLIMYVFGIVDWFMQICQH